MAAEPFTAAGSIVEQIPGPLQNCGGLFLVKIYLKVSLVIYLKVKLKRRGNRICLGELSKLRTEESFKFHLKAENFVLTRIQHTPAGFSCRNGPTQFLPGNEQFLTVSFPGSHFHLHLVSLGNPANNHNFQPRSVFLHIQCYMTVVILFRVIQQRTPYLIRIELENFSGWSKRSVIWNLARVNSVWKSSLEVFEGNSENE